MISHCSSLRNTSTLDSSAMGIKLYQLLGCCSTELLQSGAACCGFEGALLHGASCAGGRRLSVAVWRQTGVSTEGTSQCIPGVLTPVHVHGTKIDAQPAFRRALALRLRAHFPGSSCRGWWCPSRAKSSSREAAS